MKRGQTLINDALQLAQDVEALVAENKRLKSSDEKKKLERMLLDRNELISKFIEADLERFKYAEHPEKAQTRWLVQNFGMSESDIDYYRNRKRFILKDLDDEDDEDDDCVEDTDHAEDAENNEVVRSESRLEQIGQKLKNATSSDEPVSSNIKVKEVVAAASTRGHNLVRRQDSEDSIWDKVSLDNLCLVEVEYHTPYQYGDIVDTDKVFVYKGKFSSKETFFKSYHKSKEYLAKKTELGLTIVQICKKVNLPRHLVQNIIYYPYIRADEMLVEQFDRKFDALVAEEQLQ